MNSTSPINFISTFDGIGGFPLALTRSGMVLDTICEIDQKCLSVTARHFPGIRQIDDVRKVGIATHGRKTIRLVCGGFPCQDLSIAGKRAGLAGERSGLWFEFARVVDELEPDWVVAENVPGLLSSNKGRDFATIISWLAGRGYGVAWRILDAQYFGVAQRRRRVFIVAHLGDGRAAEVLFESEGVSRDSAPSRETGKGIAPTISARTKGGGGLGTDFDLDGGLIAETFTLRFGKDGGGKGYLGQKEGAMPLSSGKQWVAYGGNNTSGPIDVATACNAHGGTGRSDFESETFVAGPLQAHAKEHGHAMTTQQAAESNQLIWEMSHASEAVRESGDIAPTLQQRMGTGGNQVPLVGVRRLTPTECERLQGFPDGWTEGQSDSARYRQLGNAVAVPVVEWIGRRIVAAENS